MITLIAFSTLASLFVLIVITSQLLEITKALKEKK